MTPKSPKSPKVHRDEDHILEMHPQTAHKLDLMRMYLGRYPSILARANLRGTVKADDVWIIDACCGAGRHLSNQHPLNEVDGTAIRACIEARAVQRSFPETDIHVRLIDLDKDACEQLRLLTKPYLEAEGRDRVDVVVDESDFTLRVPAILRETARGDSYNPSLWFIDPFGIQEIPHAALDPITQVGKGPELIINLDVANGVDRMTGAAMSANVDENTASAHKKLLNALFGSDVWTRVPRHGITKIEKYTGFAKAYANTFPQFRYRNVYMLDGEQRWIIHLAHSKVAAEKFAATYADSLKKGLLQGGRTITQERANDAYELFKEFKGKDVDLDIMLRQRVVPLTKKYAPVVFRQAEIDGLGKYDSKAKVMHWNLAPQKHAGLPLLDLANHSEKVRVPDSQMDLFRDS